MKLTILLISVTKISRLAGSCTSYMLNQATSYMWKNTYQRCYSETFRIACRISWNTIRVVKPWVACFD